MKNNIEERQFAGCKTVVGEQVLCADVAVPQHAVQMQNTKAGWAKQTIAVLHSWNERRISRKILESLSNDQLKDIGLARDDIEKEFPKAIWPTWPK
ncbi:DUF1127 domain-containing protein [Ewingella americana]|jgi:uncharacterized protein YjiS (DUF1127 family)|uniref:DUF1127 domain-containing protein n=1 Tax=Ewingella americana TaxID=41202 RepID=A0A502GV54_9GAMM|nr:DUF1127 domain-containing protein [Ewingella americana]TPG64856.1 DUF1127 domain-containing protein [Ewingella americana]